MSQMGPDPVIRRCRLDVRFARKRKWLGDYEPYVHVRYLTARNRVPPSPSHHPWTLADAHYELGHSAVIWEAFAERTLRNISPDRVRHSGLMFAARITLAHFSVSSAMSLPKSAGEPGSAVAPNSESRASILGSARPALISLLSLSTISAGVDFGAPTPNQALASKPGKNSPTVGMSGSACERVAVV